MGNLMIKFYFWGVLPILIWPRLENCKKMKDQSGTFHKDELFGNVKYVHLLMHSQWVYLNA